MRTIILAVLALATILVSLPASAQQRGVPCGSVSISARNGHPVGTYGFRQRECDPPRQRAGHNGSNGPFFIGRALDQRARPHHRPGAFRQPVYSGQQYSRQTRSAKRIEHRRVQWAKTVHVPAKTVRCCTNNVPEGWHVR